MKLLVPCLLAAALACAQNNDKFEIRGTVVEKGVGIAGATVTLYQFGADPAQATTRTIFATTFTDAKGAFVIHPTLPGAYYLEVAKEGYFAESFDGPAADPMDSTGDSVTFDQDHPSLERRFSLMRLGEVRGRVIDEEGKPLAKLNVMVQGAVSSPYRAFARTLTDQDGSFTAAKLRPGDYVVRIGPQHGLLEVLPQFSAADLKIVDQDLETSFWPGGGDERSASPIPVAPGTSLSVGTITARKMSYYRAHVTVQSGDCAGGEKWPFSATREDDSSGVSLPLTIPCGKEFLVRNLAPGSYSFVLSTDGRSAEAKRWAVGSVEVREQNLEVALTMSQGVDISGHLFGAEGITLPPLKAMVIAFPIAGRLTIGNASLDPEGKFRILASPGGRARIAVFGLPDKFYIKEIRYGGLPVTDSIITPIGGTPTVLDIVIDDQAATLGGSVAELDKFSGRVSVVAVKWPASLESSPIQTMLMTSPNALADDQGTFKIGGLAPGEYRVFALTEDLRRRLGPEQLARLLNRAETVRVDRGASPSVTLKIIEP